MIHDSGHKLKTIQHGHDRQIQCALNWFAAQEKPLYFQLPFSYLWVIFHELFTLFCLYPNNNASQNMLRDKGYLTINKNNQRALMCTDAYSSFVCMLLPDAQWPISTTHLSSVCCVSNHRAPWEWRCTDSMQRETRRWAEPSRAFWDKAMT